ncbi:filamentous hemagglutinin N-terminal domain-containing protein [uncultured Propionivibrio sp.]|uniref:two-partner secretion domain-containing protein n=1 Tax=uncultured Propionivibrio sp. TaxID=426737 RepID=UPI0029C0E677|nr:filamentous hemagglutinin N-terminal domain-containing protein [uncultured Propionivibrio sp.]
MYRHASLNRAFRVIWNARKSSWQAVCENGKTTGKATTNARRIRRFTALATLVAVAGANAAPGTLELPTGGTVVAGSAAINTSGASMNVVQNTQRAVIDWNTFNIGAQAQVNFMQPAGGVALNRVLDTNASQIYGRLNASGQVFLVNPNGVIFAPGAQVSAGSIVASTLDIANADFLADRNRFAGTSGNAIINQGNITASPGGTIALIAARIVNTGTLTANRGNVLLGAGDKVLVDMGGPVKLQVQNSTLDTLIANGGIIKADGGHVMLTSQSANTLASSVINTTGVIEAQTLASGEKGEIVLYSHDGTVSLAGRLDAAAPNGGNGGFIETSGNKVITGAELQVTTLAPAGRTGTWLIDPTSYTVAASGGDETGTALSARLSGTNIQLQADNSITINDGVSWSANTLTLTSGGNINVNASLTATGTAGLAFEYGQATANGSGSTYSVADGARITIPTASAFSWKKGSTGTTNNLIFNNGALRFGNGPEAALTEDGQLKQPFYYNSASSDPSGRCDVGAWCKLTYSTYPLDIATGIGGDGTNIWNSNGQVLSTSRGHPDAYSGALSNKSLDISGYREGTGTIVSNGTLSYTSGDQIKVSNAYTLDSGTSYLKTATTLTNLGASTVSNVRLWVGTRDDYVAGMDSNYKLKGNLTANGFEAITSEYQQAKAIQIKNSATNDGTAILFYSTSSGADTVSDSCCSFDNVTNKDPRASRILTPQEDGSYALFIRLANLSAGAADGMTWYYAAAPISQINNVVGTVAQSAGVSAAAPVAGPSSVPETTAVSTAQQTPVQVLPAASATTTVTSPVSPPPSVVINPQGTLPVFEVSGGLAFVQLPGSGVTPRAGASGVNAGATPSSDLGGGRDPMGFMRVFVVGDGLRTPEKF